MRKAVRTAALLGAAVLLCGYGVQATERSDVCGERSVVAKVLTETWHESLTHVGVGHAGPDTVAVEIWEGETGTFTIIVTFPDGGSCLLVSGEGLTASVPKGKRL